MAITQKITQKIEVGISSNLIHSISTLICIRKCNKNLGVILEPFKKTMDFILKILFVYLFVYYQVNINSIIDISGSECLNESDDNTFQNSLDSNKDLYLESDCDEQVHIHLAQDLKLFYL